MAKEAQAESPELEAHNFSAGLPHDVLDRRGRRPHRAHRDGHLGFAVIPLAGALLAAACLIGASSASADITAEPAPPAALPPQSAFDGFPSRVAAYFAALVLRDAAAAKQFLSAELRENDGARYFRELRIVFSGERTVTFEAPQIRFRPIGGDGLVAGIATALVTIELGNGSTLRQCFITFWYWDRAAPGEAVAWLLHGTLGKMDLTLCTPPERT